MIDFSKRKRDLCVQYRVDVRAFKARVAAIPDPDQLTDDEIFRGASFPPNNPRDYAGSGLPWLGGPLESMRRIVAEMQVLNLVRMKELEDERAERQTG
jgi:hypothetical protein